MTPAIQSIRDYLIAKATELQSEKAFKAWLKADAEMQDLHIPAKWAVAIAFDREAEQRQKDADAKAKAAERKAAKATEPRAENAAPTTTTEHLRQRVEELTDELQAMTLDRDRADIKRQIAENTYQYSPTCFFSTDAVIVAYQCEHLRKSPLYAVNLFKTAGTALYGEYHLTHERDKTLAEIKASYLKLRKQYHPDRGGNHEAFCVLPDVLREVLCWNNITEEEYQNQGKNVFADAMF